MTSADATHIDWYVGLLLPRALCPHPNFGGTSDSPTPRDRFTDLIGFRLLADPSHQPPGEPSDGWPALLIDHLGAAVAPSTAGPSPLSALDLGLPIGPRAALAVISAFRLVAERDDYLAALRLLEEARDSFDATTPYHALPAAGLALQHVARMLDAGSAEDAKNDVELARRLLGRVEIRPEPLFSVSRGIEWSAGQVMSDVVDLLGAVADVLESQLSRGSGGTWQRLVRSRTPWGAELVEHARRRAGVSFLEDSFEATTRPLSESVTMRSSHPVLGPLREARLLCEFSGDIMGSRRARQELAMGLVTDSHAEASGATARHVPEALALLVSADKDKDVSSVASRAIRSGPLNQLREVAERVLRAPLYDARPTKAELALLRQAAPLLDGDQQAKALAAAMKYPTLDPVRPQSSGGQARWARLEPAFRSVAAHLPRSGADLSAATWLLGRLRDAEDTVEYVGGAVYAAAAAIDWSALDEADTADWLAWLSAGSPAAATTLLGSLGDLIVGPERTRSICGRPENVELAVRLLVERWDAELDPDPAELDQCERHMTELVSSLVRDSAQGRMSIGQWPILDVALALAMEFGLESLGEDVMGALGNPVVPLRLKSEVLDRIAAKAAQEPEHAVVAGLQGVAVTGLSGQLREQSDPFFGHAIVPSPAALRALAAAGALDAEDVVRAYSDLAASSDPIGRVEAARSAPYVMQGVDDKGQQVVQAGLLFLAKDNEPAVRAEAASSLARGEWSRFAEDAVRELLSEPGTAAPLGVLRGFAASTGGWADDWQQRIGSAVRSLLSHEAATVREAAAGLLEV